MLRNPKKKEKLAGQLGRTEDERGKRGIQFKKTIERKSLGLSGHQDRPNYRQVGQKLVGPAGPSNSTDSFAGQYDFLK